MFHASTTGARETERILNRNGRYVDESVWKNGRVEWECSSDMAGVGCDEFGVVLICDVYREFSFSNQEIKENS